MACIEIKQLSYSYPEPRTVFSGLDLKLEDGECLGLIGPNGAGKTTLFLLLAGLLKASDGEIKLLGKDATDPSLRGKIGLIFQETDNQLFSPRVKDDVAFGPLNLGCSEQESKERVDRALQAVGLDQFHDRVGHHLSGGEKRKVAIAATLSMEPELFLLDEPTSDLDPKARHDLIELLATLPQSKIVASHDFELVLELCDKVALLHAGKIQAIGKPIDILTNADLLEKNELVVPEGVKAIGKLRALEGKDSDKG